MTTCALASIVFVAGCAGSRSNSSPPHPATCVDAAISLSKTGTANYEWHAAHGSPPVSDDDVASFVAHYREVTQLTCQRDRWSAEAITCFAAAPVEAVANAGEGATNTCAKKLTCEQQHAFVAAFRENGAYPGPDCPGAK